MEISGLGITKDVNSLSIFEVTAGNDARINFATPPSPAGAQAGTVTPFRKLGTGTVHVPDATGGWLSI